LDKSVFLWVVEHRAGWLDPIFVGLSVVGYFGLVWIALAALLAYLRGRSIPIPVALTAACVWSADLISLGLKAAVQRPRPFETIPQPDPLLGGATIGQSMPSGHAATSFAGAVVLTYFFPRSAPYVFLLAVAIAFSRVYIGVHYPSDVIAGAALGTCVGLAGVLVVRRRLPTSAARRRSEGAPKTD
jgi:undecaprenyl-diphosphatase